MDGLSPHQHLLHQRVLPEEIAVRPLPREGTTQLDGMVANGDSSLDKEFCKFGIPGGAPELIVDLEPRATCRTGDTYPNMHFNPVELAHMKDAMEFAFGSPTGEVDTAGDAQRETVAADPFG